jgi:hypothetical protein
MFHLPSSQAYVLKMTLWKHLARYWRNGVSLHACVHVFPFFFMAIVSKLNVVPYPWFGYRFIYFVYFLTYHRNWLKENDNYRLMCMWKGESTLSPPTIVITSIIFLHFFGVRCGHHILGFFFLFYIYLISFKLKLVNAKNKSSKHWRF